MNYPNNHVNTLVDLIERQQEALDLADEAIADALGYADPAVLRLIKSGQMKLPMNKAFALAQILEVEPGDVMHRLLSEQAPEMLKSIEECMGPLALTPGEKRLLAALRRSAGGREVAPIFFEGTPIVAVVVG